MIVVVDDERTFDLGEEINYIRTSQDAIKGLSHYAMLWEMAPAGAFDRIREIWLDHDLGEMSDNDGVTVATFITLMMRAQPEMFYGCKIYIHSQNPVGARNILHVFGRAGVESRVVGLPTLV